MTVEVSFHNTYHKVKMLPEKYRWRISDWYHTFNELYDHRIALYMKLVNTWLYDCHKSKKHNDWTEREWRFICMMYIHWKQVSYHAPDKYRDLFECEEREKADEWDWHTSNDVLSRLWLNND